MPAVPKCKSVTTEHSPTSFNISHHERATHSALLTLEGGRVHKKITRKILFIFFSTTIASCLCRYNSATSHSPHSCPRSPSGSGTSQRKQHKGKAEKFWHRLKSQEDSISVWCTAHLYFTPTPYQGSHHHHISKPLMSSSALCPREIHSGAALLPKQQQGERVWHHHEGCEELQRFQVPCAAQHEFGKAI